MKKKINRFSKKGTEHEFVVRQINDENNRGRVFYYTEPGHGFSDHIGNATRYSEEQGIRKLGELLHGDKLVCELVDVSTPYESPVKVGTVVLQYIGSGLKNATPKLITAVPQIKGDTLTLFSATEGVVHMKINDFLTDVEDEFFEILWDPEMSAVPVSNHDWLETHNFINEEGQIEE